MADVIRKGPYPELTWPAIIVGWLLGAIIAISIGYAALILGFSIEGSELAAILGWGILRGVLRRTSIVENNINQSIASAVNAASSGMMFSVPALFILSDRYDGLTDFNRVLMIVGCVIGAVVGLSFVIGVYAGDGNVEPLAFLVAVLPKLCDNSSSGLDSNWFLVFLFCHFQFLR